jgi:hypothetical protein
MTISNTTYYIWQFKLGLYDFIIFLLQFFFLNILQWESFICKLIIYLCKASGNFLGGKDNHRLLHPDGTSMFPQ